VESATSAVAQTTSRPASMRIGVTTAVFAAAGVLLAAGLLAAFWWAPTDASTMGFSQKIFYFHVPVAEASFLVFAVAAYFAIRFLVTRRKEFDTKSRIAMEVTLLFVILTMITGDLWTRASWGVWWQWEPRLTTYFIMTLLVIAYFVLRNSVEDEERRAVYASVFCIIAFIDAPISFMITRIIPSDHPVVFTEAGSMRASWSRSSSARSAC